MTEKELGQNTEWLIQLIPYLWASLISLISAMIGYLNRIDRRKMKFNFFRFALESVTGSFVGIITFLLCEIADLNWSTSAILMSISAINSAKMLNLYSDVVFETVSNFLKSILRRVENGDNETEISRTQETSSNAKKPRKRLQAKNANL